MRLGLVLDQVIVECGGTYSTDEAFIQFLEAAAVPTFDRIDFCSRVLPADADAPYGLDPSRFVVRPLPWYPSIGALCLNAPVLLPRLARLFDAWLPEWDMVMACGVHPITSLVLRMARRRGIPAQLWVRGDLVADVQHKYSGVRRLAAVAIARMTTASIPNGTPVVSIGRDDYPFLARMGPVRVAFSSKFGEEELVAEPRVARGSSEARRILYVGRISAEKGLDVLIEAIRVLETRRPGAFALTLVGSDLTGSAYGDAFRSRLAASKMADAVTIRGYVPYGPALWNVYDSHDVLVLPSFTEGFPQVLFEAMARGIPIVATAVGGVPTLVRDGENGLLIPPGRPDVLADAVARLVDDPGLSERLSRAGLTCAAAHSRRTQVESISAFTTACLGGVG